MTYLFFVALKFLYTVFLILALVFPSPMLGYGRARPTTTPKKSSFSYYMSPPHPEESSTSNAEDLYLESYAFTTAAALVGSVDRKIFVLLRDGRNLFGILRTFDQFANLVLQDTIERIYLPDSDGQNSRFAEAPRGVFMVRGENVVMLGELDIDHEDDHLDTMRQIGYAEAEAELRLRHAARISEEKARAKRYLARGLIHDFVKSDMY